MKKTLSILMALLLLWSMALPAAAAETAAAATLRLEKAEGTVKVSNASGKSMTVTDGMRLYSGYTIATEKNSYAYVSLDSTKAVKLDASSKAEVRKSGKKLELNAVSGSLFFNVTAPVDKDESLNIRTSTMVTGVRGTSGWVVVIDRFTSRVHLLEGTLTVTSSEPATGQMRQATITGGQTATAALNKPSQAGSQMSLTVTNLQEKQVPGFVAVAVAENPALQGKIAAKSPLSVPAIIGDAWARLENEQASANAADQKIQKDLNNIAADEVDQVFQNTAEDDDDDDDDDAPSVPPQPDPTPTPDPTPSDMDLDGPTAAALKAALETPGVTNVTVTNAGANDLSTESYTVSSGQTLDIRSGTFTVGSGQTLDVAGTLTNSGTLDVAGTANITGTAENSGTITITSTNSLHVAGTLTNTGTIQVGGTAALGLLDIQAGGTLNNTSGSISVAANSSLTAAGSLNNDGSLTNAGNFSLISTGTFTCKGTYTENRTDQLYALSQSTDGTVYYLGPASQMSGWYTSATVTLLGASSGTLSGGTVSASGAVLDLNGHTADLSSTLTIAGELKVRGGAGSGLTATTLTAAGLSNDGTLTMLDVSAACQLYNTGTMDLTDCSVTVSDGYAIYSSGKLTLNGGTAAGSKGCGLKVGGGTAEISGSTVTSSGGNGIELAAGTLNFSDGAVTSNTAGILVSGGTLNMKKGTVTTSGGAGIEMTGGTVEISGGTVSSEIGQGASISGGTLTMTGGTVSSVSGSGMNVYSSAASDSDTVDGTVIISGGTVTSASGYGIYIMSSGKVTVNGGAVTSNSTGYDAIAVTGQGTLAINGGTVTLTAEKPSGYAVSGPFTYTGGTVQAKTANNVCSALPEGYIEAPNGDWYVLSRRVSDVTTLGTVWTESASDFVTLYSPETSILINQALTIPKGKTVIIPARTTVELYNVLSGQGTLINYGKIAFGAGDSGTGSVDLTSQPPLTLVNHGTLTSNAVSTVAVMDNDSQTVTYIGPAGDSNMPWSDNTTIQLMADCTKQLTSGGQNVTLDLAGHYYEAPKTLTDPVLTVGAGSSLTITDSISTYTRISGSGSSVVAVAQGAVLTVAGGTIANTDSGDGVVVSGGTLTMTGGQITASANGINSQSGSVTISGGTVTTNTNDSSQFAVNVGSGATFTFTGGILRAWEASYLCRDLSVGQLGDPDEKYVTLIPKAP